MLKSLNTLPMRSAVRSFSRTIPRGVPATPQEPQATRPVYFVPRNSRGALPVYTDIRNSNRYLTLIRNVEGSVDVRFYPSHIPMIHLVTTHFPPDPISLGTSSRHQAQLVSFRYTRSRET